jgi:hypothetical protein
MIFSTDDGNLAPRDPRGHESVEDRLYWTYANAGMDASEDLVVGIDGVQGLSHCFEACPREGWARFYKTDDRGLVEISDLGDPEDYIIAGRVEVWY